MLQFLVKEFGAFLFYCVLAGKNVTMKHSLFIAVMLAAVSGCGFLDTGNTRFNTPRSGTILPEPARDIPGKDIPGSSAADTSVFLTAVEFDASYFWQRDTAGESEPFKLCVYRDMEKIFSIPGGPGTIVTYAPDMHRYIDGHLYTDYCTSAETIIGKDGQELFRYKGREMICGFLVKDGTVYTLGQNRGGPGVYLRSNGETLFSESEGFIMGSISDQCSPGGALYEDGGNMYFSYQVPSKRLAEQRPSLFLVENEIASEVKCNVDIPKVSDVRLIGGTIYVSGYSDGYNPYAIMVAGGEVKRFPAGSGCQIAGVRPLWSGRELYLRADFSADRWASTSAALWDNDGKRMAYSGNVKVYDYYVEGDSYAYAGTDMASGTTFTRNVQDDENISGCSLPGRYSLMDPGCAVLSGGTFYVGLTPYGKGEYPVLVKNSTPSELKINGFISSVSVSAPGK